MFPVSANSNQINCGSADMILFCQYAMDNPLGNSVSNSQHIGCRELGVIIKFSWESARSSSPFAEHITNVVRASPNEQMSGIATKAIVACMANLFALWDRSICQLICHTMSKIVSSISPKTAISSLIFSALPFPTGFVSVTFVNSGPKSLGYWRTMMLIYSARHVPSQKGDPRRLAALLSRQHPKANGGHKKKNADLWVTLPRQPNYSAFATHWQMLGAI